MAKDIRIGVIGTGIIGKSHINTYVNKVPGAKVVALCDIDEAELKRVAAANGNLDTYTDFRKLLERDDIEAVDVCLHNNLHMPVTVAALEAGKHVYCEKPMAGAYKDAKTMYDTARKLGRKLSIQLAGLFSKETRAAKQLIDAGALGKIYHARSTGFRRRGRPYVDGYATPEFVKKEIAAGGALYDMGVYHISVILWLLGMPEVVRVSGKTYQETAMDEERRRKSGYSVEELGTGFVRFKNDLTMDVIEAWAIHLDQIEGSTVVGNEGGIRLSPFGYFRTLADLETNSTVNLDGAASRWKNVYGLGDKYDSPQHHWVRVLQGEVELLPTAELALATMFVQEGIFLSSELGREVTAEEILQHSKSKALKVS